MQKATCISLPLVVYSRLLYLHCCVHVVCFMPTIAGLSSCLPGSGPGGILLPCLATHK